MTIDRRHFLKVAAAGVVTGLVPKFAAAGSVPIKAIAFDGFPVFDPKSVFAKTEALFPGKGMELATAWRSRLFEYQWLRVVGGQYADFWKIGQDSLAFAAKMLSLDMTTEKSDEIMHGFLEMKAWPDALPALTALKKAGIRMAFLSNLTSNVLDASIKSAGLDGIFEPSLTTDRIKSYKPDPRAYQMGLDAFKLKREEIAFAASSGWDAAGAKWFGYPTVWVNRQKQPVEELSTPPDLVATDLNGLAEFVKATH
jgi:2-haloacid dehalogenase